MGLLDKVLGDAPATLDAREAFAGIVLAAACADGVIHEAEADAIADALRTKQLFAALSGRDASRMFTKLARILRDEGDDALLARASAALPPELRLTAFAVAMDLVLADRELHDKERVLLDKLRTILHVTPRDAERIELVLRVKNAA